MVETQLAEVDVASPLASSASLVSLGGTLGIVEGPQWNQIKRHLYPAEVSAVRRLVGENCIRETKVAWQELNSLRQMLKEFQDQNDALNETAERTAAEREKFFQNPQRDLLKQQANLLIEDVRRQEATGGKSLQSMLDQQELRTAQFILGGKSVEDQCVSRPPSGLGGYPQTPSTRPSSRSTTRPSTGASERGQPFALGHQLGASELQTVADQIREALQEEHEALLSAIEEQNHLLEMEADVQAHAYRRSKVEEPSTADLRQLVHKLQGIITSPGFQVTTMQHPPRRPEGSFTAGGRVRMLQTLIQQSRREAAEASALDEEPESPPASPMAAGCKSPQQKQSTAGTGSSSGYNADRPPIAAATSAPASTRKLDPFFDDPFG